MRAYKRLIAVGKRRVQNFWKWCLGGWTQDSGRKVLKLSWLFLFRKLYGFEFSMSTTFRSLGVLSFRKLEVKCRGFCTIGAAGLLAKRRVGWRLGSRDCWLGIRV